MRYIHLEKVRHPISRIVIGSTWLGTRIDVDTTHALLDAYFELGGNTVDVARLYGQGVTEQVIGEYLKDHNLLKDINLVTKGLHHGEGDTERFSEQNLSLDIAQSQDALQTDSFDIWFFHRDNPNFPVDEIMDMVAPYVQKGVIRTLGASNWSTDRIEEANSWATKHNKPLIEVSQIQFSIARTTGKLWDDPTLECMNDESYQWYKKSEMPLFAFSSQAKGFYSKAIEKGEKPSSLRFYTPENEQKIERVKSLSEKYNVSAATIALSYVTSALKHSVAIIGCSNVEQMHDSMSAQDVVLESEDISFLESGKR